MEFVRQHIVALAAVFIIWFGYGHLSEEPEAAAEKKKLQAIAPRYLAIRAADQPALLLEDPYRFTELEELPAEDPSTAASSSDDEEGMNSRFPTASREDGVGTSPLQGQGPEGGASGSPSQAAIQKSALASGSGKQPNTNTKSGNSGGSGKQPNTNMKGGSSGGSGKQPNTNMKGGSSGGSGKQPNTNMKGGSGRGPNPNGGGKVVGGAASGRRPLGGGEPEFFTDAGPIDLPPMEHPVRLWLDAVLAVPGGGSARVSGVHVEVGESIPELDEDVPPVLVATEGMSATVRYREVEYTLTLDGPPVVIQPRDADAVEGEESGS